MCHGIYCTPEVLLLPSGQGFALQHFLGHSENFVLVGFSLAFGSRLFWVQEFWFSAAAAALSLPQKRGIGAVVVYVVWRNAHLCEIHSGGAEIACMLLHDTEKN